MRVLRKALFGTLAGVFLVSASAGFAKAPTSWDGLTQVPSKRLNLVYLLPGADFSGYTKVMIDTPEVAFQKNWRRDYNNTTRSPSQRVSESEIQDAISQGVTAASDIFAEAWTKGGFAVVTTPGPDVLRIRVGIVNIRVTAPEQMDAGRSYSFASEAGSATLFVEAKDSMTGALLGRAVDQRLAGDNPTSWRTAMSNRADFRELVQNWATASVRGMNELKARSPVKP